MALMVSFDGLIVCLMVSFDDSFGGGSMICFNGVSMVCFDGVLMVCLMISFDDSMVCSVSV